MRRYSNNAAQTTLSAAATAAQTSISVTAVTGFPSVEFVLALDYGTSNQELVLVTAVSGTSLTVTRGYDNTTALSHAVGAVVVHTHSAADFADSRSHEAATTDVHGVTGALVGVSDAQALTHKDLSDPTNTFPTALAKSADLLAHTGASSGVHGVTGSVVGTTDTQTLTNKTLDTPTATGSLAGFGGTWTAYTPTWTTSGTSPAIGNGSITGAWTQIGKTVHFRAMISMGSTTSYGTGIWYIGLPANGASASGFGLGVANCYDSSAGRRYVRPGVFQSPASVFLPDEPAASYVGATGPFTWAAGDYLAISGTYEVA